MLYEELMMDSGMLAKFSLFKRITQINQTDISITQLSEELFLNYQQTSIIVTEINNDLVKIISTHPSILKKAGKIDSTKLLVTIDEYRYFLLKKSVPFQYIFYFLNHDSPNIDDFCERYYVSRSTVSRKMLPLKNHVKQFNLRFTYTEANLTGDERSVRVALFDALWLGTRGTTWPFKSVAIEDAQKLAEAFAEYFPLSRTYLGSRELTYFAAIFLCRTRKKYFVSYDERYDFLLMDNPYYDFDRLNKELGPIQTLSPEHNKAESSFIFFLSHYAPFYTLDDDPSLFQTLHDFSTRPNPVYELVQEFIAYAKINIFKKEPEILDKPIIIGNLLNITFTFFVLRQPFPNLQKLVEIPQQKKKADESLERKLQQFFDEKAQEKEYKFVYTIKKPLIAAFKSVLLPSYDKPQHSEHLKVGVAFEHNFTLVRMIYQFLNDLGFVDSAPYQEEQNDSYDLVISSSLLPRKKYPDIPLYFWDLSYSNKDLADLYKILQQLFEKKNIIQE
ncbi:helix-turn-helix domain-containing protein [Candidatus Enterococcus ikei]|uniref:Helix-turn-helix domain-containing protein n=1 Tax=Candidatus Enterococcus ikei TaxID=2815326 RepID=A0ABS3H2T2_9ENTE|nr:helix-turn-helix domain-containing protein [Enterococcus sp. DIV0869a]MBO0441350.1 helix-turn-helix domain-containing protein [Enterococcus sp. DIV0869a]